jgi:Cyclic nucleotide-binding domain.
LEPLDILHQQIFAVHALDDEAWQELSQCWTEIDVKRKQMLTRTGDTEKFLYLVLDGVQRAFFQHGDKEATLVFSYAPSFSGVIDSFFTQTPSKFHLETLTQSKLLRIHYDTMMTLMEKHRSIETWVRVALMGVLAGTLQRQTELMAFTAEEKFTTLLRRSPQVLNMIPHKYLASYIGVDPTTFSKMMASVKI